MFFYMNPNLLGMFLQIWHEDLKSFHSLTHYSLVLLFYTSCKEKTLRFSDVFREYRKATLGCNGLSCLKLTRELLFCIFASSCCHNQDKVFKTGPRKICGRQSLKNLKRGGLLKGCLPQILLGPLLNICPNCGPLYALVSSLWQLTIEFP